MEYEFDSMMGFDKLGLYYEAHILGIDGENFHYSVYFKDSLTDEKFKEADQAIGEFVKSLDDKETYLGYIDVSKTDNKVNIELDLGNVDAEASDMIIKGILQALNHVSGIESVMVNENCTFDF